MLTKYIRDKFGISQNLLSPRCRNLAARASWSARPSDRTLRRMLEPAGRGSWFAGRHEGMTRSADRSQYRWPNPGTHHHGPVRVTGGSVSGRGTAHGGRHATATSHGPPSVHPRPGIGGGKASPTPRRCENIAATLSRSAWGNGGLMIEAMFCRRCPTSPVPNRTTSTPGSWRT